ncbi:MAG: bacteriohemerythrin [Candidatus Thiodiazotropha endolucinida]|uniref:Bacteriohemerythrin n=1 Tax=Candidatus Thiodiazotropha endolucinida TaxID=1655433 RepID=A0A7Z0VPI7_9GAMM|nr:bacteriohemerythrin [Candidatus Thiodiazotropha endolucinida]ODJ88936.1 bacteriohemerythrin [Candidatus Thiodiazotropha endolucinida]
MQNRLQGWSKEYELGIKEIDLQHQYFFRLITRLADELKNSSDFPYQKSLFVELGLYTHFHFVSEENLMQRSGYPGLHEHNKLIDGLNKNKLLFEEGHIEAIQVIDFLKMWFISHTVKEDRKFAEYIIG